MGEGCFTIWKNEVQKAFGISKLIFPGWLVSALFLWEFCIQIFLPAGETERRSKGGMYFRVLTHVELFREHVGSERSRLYFPPL